MRLPTATQFILSDAIFRLDGFIIIMIKNLYKLISNNSKYDELFTSTSGTTQAESQEHLIFRKVPDERHTKEKIQTRQPLS